MRGQDLVDAARCYVGTPFHHQGRLLNVGVDCAGLLICSARDAGRDLLAEAKRAGFNDDQLKRYGKDLKTDYLTRMLEVIAEPIQDLRVGAVLLFRVKLSRSPHLGIRTHKGMIHAFDRVGEVVETGIDTWWYRFLESCWALKGME